MHLSIPLTELLSRFYIGKVNTLCLHLSSGKREKITLCVLSQSESSEKEETEHLYCVEARVTPITFIKRRMTNSDFIVIIM